MKYNPFSYYSTYAIILLATLLVASTAVLASEQLPAMSSKLSKANILTRFAKRFEESDEDLIISRKNIEKDISDMLEDHGLTGKFRDRVLRRLTDEVMYLQWRKRDRIRKEMAVWGRGFVEREAEVLSELFLKLAAEGLLDDMLEGNVTSRTVAIVMAVLKQIFADDGRPPALLDNMEHDLCITAQRIAGQIGLMLQSGLYNDFPRVLHQISQIQNPNQLIAERSLLECTPRSAPPPIVAISPIDLIIAIYRPDINRPESIVKIAWYEQEVKSFRLLGAKMFVLKDEMNDVNFQIWAKQLQTWLSGSTDAAEGLAGAVSEVVSGRKLLALARETEIRLHVMIAGAAPIGFSYVVSDIVVPKLTLRFKNRIGLKAMQISTWTYWDAKTLTQRTLISGEKQLAPLHWPSS